VKLIPGLTYTKSRSKVADFAITLIYEKFTLIAPLTSDQSADVLVYAKMFTLAAWCVCAAMMFSLSIGLFIIECLEKESCPNSIALLNRDGFTKCNTD
jgi:hypothetical protein